MSEINNYNFASQHFYCMFQRQSCLAHSWSNDKRALVFYRPDISNLMMAMTTAMAQGPGTAAFSLAHTFQPLVQMAISMQLSTLNAANPSPAADAAPAGEQASQGNGSAPVVAPSMQQTGTSGRHVAPAGQQVAGNTVSRIRRLPTVGRRPRPLETFVERDGSDTPASAGEGNRSQRRRKLSSRLAEYVDVDSVL